MLLGMTACGGGAGGPTPSVTDTPPASTSSAPAGSRSAIVEIQVQVGEQCHPEPLTPGPSCRPQPRPDTEVSVEDAATHEVVKVRTDADGAARVAVRPGTYVVRAPAADGYPEAPEQTVTVARGGVARAVLTYVVGFQ